MNSCANTNKLFVYNGNMMNKITFIKRTGDFVLWRFNDYIYQIENRSANVKIMLLDTEYEDALIQLERHANV